MLHARARSVPARRHVSRHGVPHCQTQQGHLSITDIETFVLRQQWRATLPNSDIIVKAHVKTSVLRQQWRATLPNSDIVQAHVKTSGVPHCQTQQGHLSITDIANKAHVETLLKLMLRHC